MLALPTVAHISETVRGYAIQIWDCTGGGASDNKFGVTAIPVMSLSNGRGPVAGTALEKSGTGKLHRASGPLLCCFECEDTSFQRDQ